MKAKGVLGIVLAILMTTAGCGGGGSGSRSDSGPIRPPMTDPPDRPPVVTPEAPGAIPPDGQAFTGQDALVAKVTANGRELQGKVFIWDPTYEAGNTDPTNHHNRVKKYLLDNGVPEPNIIGDDTLSGSTIGDPTTYPMNRFFGSDFATQRAETRVVVIPTSAAFVDPGASDRISANNVLFVTSAGNTAWDEDANDWDLDSRNIYRPDYRGWIDLDTIDGQPEGYSSYAETLAAADTGKAIFAVWADVNEEGEVVPYLSSVKCGGVKHACFAVVLEPFLYGSSGHGTSFAAPTVGAAAFYLRQLWDRAEEVVGVMKQCAIDIGAPGVDDEFGNGAVNVNCDQVARREVRTVEQSVSTTANSPAMASLTGFNTPLGGGEPIHSFTRTPEGSGYGANDQDTKVAIATKTFANHNLVGIGKHVRFEGGEVIALVGSGRAPLGVHSHMVSPGELGQTAFAEIGGRADLFRFDEFSSLSAVGSYGYDTGGMKPQVLRLGLQAKQGDERSLLQVYVGYAQVSGEIGIPGREEVGRDKVSFTMGAPEARLSYMVRF